MSKSTVYPDSEPCLQILPNGVLIEAPVKTGWICPTCSNVYSPCTLECRKCNNE